jgi:hypothetical protein
MTAVSSPGVSQPQRRPFLRILMLGIGIIIAFVIVGVIVISTMRSSRNQPISVDTYPGANVLTNTKTNNSDKTIYETPDSVQQVFNFYVQKFGLSDKENDGCKKVYTSAPASEEPGKYTASCVVSNSMLDVSQYLSIRIEYVTNSATKTGTTQITVDRLWGG